MACATNDDAHLLIVGNDLSTGHRRSGLNSLTSYGWDFVKLGPSGMPYKTDGKTPEDFCTQGERVLRARQMLGKVGNSGFSGVPHIHVNLSPAQSGCRRNVCLRLQGRQLTGGLLRAD